MRLKSLTREGITMNDPLYIAVDDKNEVIGAAYEDQPNTLSVDVRMVPVSGKFELRVPTPELLKKLKPRRK